MPNKAHSIKIVHNGHRWYVHFMSENGLCHHTSHSMPYDVDVNRDHLFYAMRAALAVFNYTPIGTVEIKKESR